MYSTLPADIRHEHPYHMYDEIRAQPEAVARSLTLFEAHGRAITDACGQARTVYLTGCGTSYHAAQIGAWLLRSFTAGSLDARAVGAFELAAYLPPPVPGDIVIGVSHSGTTAMTARAVRQAGEAGATTIALTGFPESEIGAAARTVLSTGYNDERSWAHTVSYTAALATLAALANSLAGPEERLDLTELADVMRDALTLEEMAHRMAAGTILAERFRGPSPIAIVGGGPNAVTARETMLKLLETSYVQASAWELEEMLHGPLAATTEDTLLIVLAPPGRSIDRASQLTNAAGEIGMVPIVLTAEETANRFDAAHRLLLPDVPEVLSPLPYIVPLQLFSYFLAVGQNLNPDLIHRDDERYRRAAARY